MINLPVPFNKAICTLSRRLATAALSTSVVGGDQRGKAGCGQHDGPVTGTTKASSVHLCQCPAHPSQHVAYQSNGRGHKSHERISKRCFASTVKQREGKKSVVAKEEVGTMSVNESSLFNAPSVMEEEEGQKIDGESSGGNFSTTNQVSPDSSIAQQDSPSQSNTSPDSCTEFGQLGVGEEEANFSSSTVVNPYIGLGVEEIMQQYSQLKESAGQDSLTLDQYNEFLFALRCRKGHDESLLLLEDMKMSSVIPDAKSYANTFLSGAYMFFANELEDLVTSNIAIFSPQDKRYNIKKRLAQIYLEAINERGIQFQGELFAPLIMSCVARDGRKEFAASAYVFCKLCISRQYPIAYSVYSYTMASLNKHDLDSLVVSLYESIPQDVINYHLQLHYLRALIKLDRASEVFRLLDGFMEGKEKKIQIFNVLINAALRRGHLMIARSLYSKIQSMEIKPDDTTQSLFIEHAGKQNEGAAVLLEEFIQEAQKQQLTDGPKYLNALIKAYARLDVGKIIPVLHQAANSNVVDKQILETVITLMSDNRIPSYLKLEIYTSISKFVAGKHPKDTFVASMYALIDSRILELFAAIEEIPTVPEGKPSPPLHSESAFRAIMRGFIGRRQSDAVLAFIEYIIGKNTHFTATPSYLFNAALEVAIERGDYVQAIDIAKNMRYRGIAMKPYVKEKMELLKARTRKPSQDNVEDEVEQF